jgi:hypothetical protein
VDTASKYETGRQPKVKGMRPQAIKAIDALKPYKGGNDLLWKLHKLNNIDKHRALITAASAFRSFNIGGYMRFIVDANFPRRDLIPDAFFRPADRMCPLKVGDILFTGLPDEEINEQTQFAFEIAFCEPQISEGEPLVETVHYMGKAISDIIIGFRPLLV